MAVWPVRMLRRDAARRRPPLPQMCLSLLPGPRRRRDCDPFEVLRVQYNLARLDVEIETVRRDDARFAQAHHLRAAMTAYDGILAEACALAGVEVTDCGFDAVSRLQAEAALQACGWSW